MNTQMEAIDTLAQTYARARDELAERLESLRDEQEQARRRRIQGIKNSVARYSAAHADLLAAIDTQRHLFQKPRTRVLHGIKLGVVKQPGKLVIDSPASCVAALRRLLGDQAEAYIKRSESPVRSALANLPAKDLKRVGVTVTDDIDAVVIKSADGELDKLISALVADPDLDAPKWPPRKP